MASGVMELTGAVGVRPLPSGVWARWNHTRTPGDSDSAVADVGE